MSRWTILAVTFVVVACSKGERDRLTSDAPDTTAGPDSALPADAGAMESRGGATDTAAGAPETAGARRTETKRAATADRAVIPAAGTDRTTGPSGAEAMGGVRTATPRGELSADQVRQLQTALNDAGCNAGTPDGVMGRRTRQAIACGLAKHNLGSKDLNGLYRALDLDF